MLKNIFTVLISQKYFVVKVFTFYGTYVIATVVLSSKLPLVTVSIVHNKNLFLGVGNDWDPMQSDYLSSQNKYHNKDARVEFSCK